jgi:predicted nucleotidyltransferase
MKAQIIEIIKSYFMQKPEVVAVYLFGSYAKDDEHRTSDIDIGILIKENLRTGASEKRIGYMAELANLLKKDIHPVVLNSASEVLIRQVFLKGECILVKDSQELARYKMMMISRIADFGYYRNMIHSGFVSKVMEG